MKRFIPIKYTLGMVFLFWLVPVAIFLALFFFVNMNDHTIAISIFLGCLAVFGGPVAYIANLDNASVVIENGMLTNNINDGTLHFGWTEEIGDINSIKIVNTNDVSKIYKNCKAKKVLLIDFGYGNVKYIAVGLFTKYQIKKMMQILQPM